MTISQKHIFISILCCMFALHPFVHASITSRIMKFFKRPSVAAVCAFTAIGLAIYLKHKHTVAHKHTQAPGRTGPAPVRPILPAHQPDQGSDQLSTDQPDQNIDQKISSEISTGERLVRDNVLLIVLGCLQNWSPDNKSLLQDLVLADPDILCKSDINGVTIMQLGGYICPDNFIRWLFEHQNEQYIATESGAIKRAVNLELAIINEFSFDQLTAPTTAQQTYHRIFTDSGSTKDTCIENIAKTIARLTAPRQELDPAQTDMTPHETATVPTPQSPVAQPDIQSNHILQEPTPEERTATMRRVWAQKKLTITIVNKLRDNKEPNHK